MIRKVIGMAKKLMAVADTLSKKEKTLFLNRLFGARFAVTTFSLFTTNQ
ncbi:hypothetical protein [Janthinobacterium sp.]|nr:hypothetical protein [Janthinobacterium sp.]